MFSILKLIAKISNCDLTILKIQKHIPLAFFTSFWHFSTLHNLSPKNLETECHTLPGI